MSETIDAIKARARAATPGPWEAETSHGYITGHVRAAAHEYSGGTGRSTSVTSQESMTADDAYFIAHARTDIPELLLRLEDAEGDNWRLRLLLWLNHGHAGQAAYGDDGEMQCPMCPLDFKRATLTEIENSFFLRHLRLTQP